MKNILLILSLVIWCGCSSEIPFDTNKTEDMAATRTTSSDSIYYWGSLDLDIVEDFMIYTFCR